MPKRHCPKHASYYYRCPDCRRLNEENAEFTPTDSGRTLYPDAYGEGGEVRIPVEGPEAEEPQSFARPPPVRRQADRQPPHRYRGGYSNKPAANRKKIAIFGSVLLGIVIFLIVIWAIPSWYANIDLQMQLYNAKAGGFQYWSLYTLSGWSSNFFFNYTALIGGLIGMVLMVLPVPDRAVLSLIAELRGRPAPTRAKAYAIWLPVGFGLFYLFGQLMDVSGMFGWGMFLVQKGEITVDSSVILNALGVLFNPGSVDMGTIFAYQYVYLPVINMIFGVIIFRIILAIVEYAYLKQNYVLAAANALLLVGVFFGVALFNLPLQPVDGLAQIQNWSVVFGIFSFLGMGLFLYLFGLGNKKRPVVNKSFGRKVLVAGGIAFIILAIPLFISIPTAIGINTGDYATWTAQEWDKEIQTEIAWTRSTAGTTAWDSNGTGQSGQYPISTLVTGNANVTQDQTLLGAMRLFDQTYAYQKMLPQTKTAETLAAAEVVYINGKEYWIAPKTVDWDTIESGTSIGAIQLDTNLYDHIEGFYAMDTHSNELLTPAETQQIFNASSNYPIFFGEHQAEALKSEFSPSSSSSTSTSSGSLLSSSTSTTWAYDQPILLSTQWNQNTIQGYQYQWNQTGGVPDGTLSGLEKFWENTNMGLFSYAISQANSSYLINRYIMTRVGNMMFPGLTLDQNPYLVFDIQDGKVYYAVSIYVNMPLHSYAQSNILRFIGVCLVDVETGTLQFVRNPQYANGAPSVAQDMTAPFWSFYLTNQAYPWEAMPAWLLSQFRYPEDLYSKQLNVDYTYHVGNPGNWLRGDSWYKLPDNGQIFYIETALEAGGPLEFVGVNVAEQFGTSTEVLAGIYVVQSGANCGTIRFYNAANGNSTTEIGPNTAYQYLSTVAAQQLTLIGSTTSRLGNTLLYPLAGSVYYLMPIYKDTTTSEGTLENLNLIGFVNATDHTTAFGYDPSASNSIALLTEAYQNLNLTYIAAQLPAASNVTLTYNLGTQATWNGTNTLTANFANLQFNLNYKDLGGLSYDPVNVIVNITVHSGNAIVLGRDGSLASNSSFGSPTYWNYTVLNSTTMYPGDGVTFSAKLNENLTGTPITYDVVTFDIVLKVDTVYGPPIIIAGDGLSQHTVVVTNAS